MNHYINFIEAEEIKPYVPIKSKKYHTQFFIALYLGILTVLGLNYMANLSLIKEGEQKKKEWAGIEQEVQSLVDLNNGRARLSTGYHTLLGWQSSRVPWAEFFMYLVSELPGKAEDIQLNRLQFDEIIEGLRHQIPGEIPKVFYPLKRQVSLSMSGVLKSNQPELQLVKFQRNMLIPRAEGTLLETMPLKHYDILRDKDRQLTDLTEFSFTVNLAPRELVP